MANNLKFPGDKIGYIEEYIPGNNTYENNEVLRATVIGSLELNNSEKSANIVPQTKLSVPMINDIITGTVVITLGAMIVISIDFINERRVHNNVECICQTRHLRKKNVALANDIIKARIVSRKNGTLHATIDDKNLGVLFTKCRKCSGVVGIMRDAIKCKECGWIDDRKLSSEFGNEEILPSEK